MKYPLEDYDLQIFGNKRFVIFEKFNNKINKKKRINYLKKISPSLSLIISDIFIKKSDG